MTKNNTINDHPRNRRRNLTKEEKQRSLNRRIKLINRHIESGISCLKAEFAENSSCEEIERVILRLGQNITKRNLFKDKLKELKNKEVESIS